uniref:Peptidase aspartic active site n=1 Tax=Echinococcus granulosus TaxID=6210 RepID=A0A068W929_ECHGR|nr:Peptidase aspartic active site [Echinococcus granulosus]
MYQRKKLEHLDCENRRLQRQQMLEDFALLQSKQSALNNIMDSFGYGHRIASSWKDPMIEEQKRLSTMRVVAKKRFDEAYTDLLVTRARSLREAEMRHHFRETARAAEQARAAAVAALPPPSCDPLDPHLNPNGDACTRCLSEVHKECHLVVDANRVPLGSGNWGRERAKKSEKRSGLLGGGVMAGEAQCGLNVCHLDSSCATGAANDDAFTTAAAENARADLAHRRTLRLATEAALKSRIRAQLALKRTHAMQEYELLTQHPDPVPVGGLRIDQSIHIHDGSSFVERPLPSSSDEKPIPDTQCTTLMHPSPDLSGLGPGERAGLPPLALSPRQSLIAQPLLSPHPASDSSQTLIFRKSDSSEATGLDSTGTNALNAFKPLEVHFNVNKVPDLESYCVSGVNNILSSTELSEITSFDRIKMQLDSEVENIDKAIRELRETFNKSILSRRSAQGIEVNLTRISPPSTSSDSVTIHPQSPLEVIDVQPGTTTMTGVTQDRTLYRTENRPSGFIDGRIGTDMRGTKCQMICNNFDALKESVESGHYTSHMLSLVDVRSNEKGKEKQSPSPTAPIIISPSPVPLLITETGAFTLAKSGTGAKPFAVVESLRRRARELILRQTECIRASNAENHASACETPGQLPHCFISLAHGDDADLQSLSLPAKTPIFSPVKLSHNLDDATSLTLSTPPLNSCHSWAQPMMSPASDLFPSLQRLSPLSQILLSPPSSYAMPSSSTSTPVAAADQTTISSKISLTGACLLAFKEAGDDDVDLFTGTIGDFVVRKKELLRHYLKQLLETYRMKSEISTLHCSGTYLSPTSTSQIRLINNVVSKSTDRISPVCPNQYNNNFKPRNTLPSDETLGPNPPKPLERDVFSRQSPPCSDSDLLQGCFKRRFCEQNEILKPINHSVHSSASTPHAKEHSVSHLNRNDSGDALSSTFFPRFVTSSSSALEISCDSSSGRPLNQFSVLSCQTLPISLTSTDTEKNFKSSASMRQKFTITESASGTLGTHRQSSPVNHLPSQSGFIRLQAPEAAKEYIVYDSSPLHQEGKTDSIKTYLGADLLQVPVQNQLANKTVVRSELISGAPSQPRSNESAVFSCASRALSTNLLNFPTFSTAPDATCETTSSNPFLKPTPIHLTSSPSSAQNCIWFQRIKYSLQSIATGLEDKMNSQIISNASIPTDSTPNSSSRPSNQFSCLSSQSPCFPAEVPFVSELEASQEPIPYKPVAPSVTSGGSATTTLHALRSGLSIGSGNEFKESHVQPSGDVSVGTLNIVKGERHTSASTLARLRGDVMADESSSPLSSDLSSIITTNNNASPLRQSNDLMNGEKEPPPGTLLNSHSLPMRPPFKIRMLLHPPKSPSVDLDTCSSARLQLERVSRGVGTSSVSTLMRLQSESILPTPISDTNRKSTLLARFELTNPSKSLPVVNRCDDIELIGSDSTMSAHPLENPTFYSLTTYCNAGGGRITPSYNANALSESTDKKCGTRSRNQSTETYCETCASIDMSSSPSVSLHSFLDNEACVESSAEQNRNGEGIFHVGRTFTVQTHFFNAPSPSGGVIHQTRRFSYSPLVPSETPLISIRLEPPSTNNVLEESETVVQTLLSADQKEEHDVAAASAFAMLPAVKVDTRKSAFSGLISSEERSNIVSSRISVGSKSIDVKASSMMSDTVKVGSMKSAAPEADTRGANNAKAIVLESVDAKVGSKEVGNAETTSAKSVGANTVSGDAVGRKASEAKVILQKLADERPIAMKPAIMGPEGVEANGGGAGAIALVSGKTADARGADAKPIGVKITDEAPTYVKYVGLKSLGGEVFVMPSAGATTAPAIELTSTKKANAKVATGESFIPKSSATKSASVLSVGVRSGFVESPSAEASGTEAKHSGPTSVKLFIAKSINRESLAAVSVTATNVGEKGLLTESITANVKSASIANLTDLEAAEMQAFSIKASALETSDQNGIPFEPAAARISVAKSNSPEPYMTELARPKVSGPSLLAADSGSTRLASAETTDIEQNLDSPLSHQPDGTVIYAVATPRDLPAYLTADTAATIARMRKVQEELERKGSNSLPNPRTRLLAGLQEELSVPPDDLSSTRSFIRKESSITFQVTLPSLTRDQSERNGSSLPQETSYPRNPVKSSAVIGQRKGTEPSGSRSPATAASRRAKTSLSTRKRKCSSRPRKRSEPAVSGEILSANFPFGRFYLRKPGSKQCSDSKGTSHQNFANPIVHKKSSRQRTKKPSRVNPPPRST